MSPELLLKRSEISARYHHERGRFLNTLHLSIQLIVFLFTATSAIWLIESFFSELLGFVLLTAASALSLCSLIFRPDKTAGLHGSLYRSFTLLTGAISSTVNPDEEICAEWSRRLHALEAEEPPLYDALLMQCLNHTLMSSGDHPGLLVDLKLRHQLFRNCWHFKNADFANRDEKKRRERAKQRERKKKRAQKQARRKKSA